MKTRELENLGFKDKRILSAAREVCGLASKSGVKKQDLRAALTTLANAPETFLEHDLYAPLAALCTASRSTVNQYEFREIPYNSWGDEIDQKAHRQMVDACRLPISVSGALMPDAHVGYGLPIGGVLATHGAVIPYAVGVDIACRVMMSVLSTPLADFKRNFQSYRRALEEGTSFGIGAHWRRPKSHEVMDEQWDITPITKGLKDLAHKQLGTSGSGNHFVEFGMITFHEKVGELERGEYIALVSHSGSRGPGSKVAEHYSKLARRLHPDLPKELSHLSWLSMEGDGSEYWEAMELMGRYASANHHVIHRDIVRSLGTESLFQIENHHNFAWKEVHEGKEVIVHRKGATPAAKGVFGYIPGTMVDPGYLVEGLGNSASLHSCSHGAGRSMSRTVARTTTTAHALKKRLREHGVELISAGLDESPHAYKDIEKVMKAQASLVRKVATFLPRLVKMAPDGERAED